MKRFFIIITTIFLIAYGICLYYAQTYETFNYHNMEEMKNFPVTGHISQLFFIKPSEQETLPQTDLIFTLIDKNGNETIIEDNVIINNYDEDVNISDDRSEAEQLQEALEEADFIVVAKVCEPYKIFYKEMQQPVFVQKVLKGDSHLEGTTIYYHEDIERFWLSSYQQVIGGLVMPMQVGEEYLLFMNEINDIMTHEKKIYHGVTPFGYFNLENKENHVLTENDTYGDVANYEFLAVDEEGLQLMLEFKKNILNMYLGEK